MRTPNERWLAWVPALIWLVFITVLSVLPSVQLPQFDLFASDKLGHAMAYAGLTGLALLALRRQSGQAPSGRSSFLFFLFAAGYGALMEFIQGAFLPNRAFELDDMLANTFGAAIGWAIAYLLFRLKP